MSSSSENANNSILDVCAAVVFHGRHVFLATRRPGAHLAGKWEFPGGKLEAGESPEQCILRELKEELGWTLQSPQELFQLTYSYPEKTVRLHFMLCTDGGADSPAPKEGQNCGWFTLQEARSLEMAPADRAAIEKIPFPL